MDFVREALSSPHVQLQAGVSLKVADDPGQADLLLCRPGGATQLLKGAMLTKRGHEQLLVIVEDSDSAAVETPPEVIRDRRTLAVLKHYVWRGYEGQCPHCSDPGFKSPPHWGTLCFNHRWPKLLEMLQSSEARYKRASPLTIGEASRLTTMAGCPTTFDAAASRKVLVAIPPWLTVRQTALWKDTPFEMLHPAQARGVDVAFVGKVSSKDFIGSWRPAGSPYTHRMALINYLASLGEKRGWKVVVGKSMPAENYYKLLFNTKIFVSPWGKGEYSHKDEEAILCGAVLMKPGAAVLEATLPIYTPNISCLDVRPDWTDLESRLATALANPGRLRQIQRTAYSAMQRFGNVDLAMRQEEVVSKFATLLLSAKAMRNGR